MNAERMQILEMLAAGKLTTTEADMLLSALGTNQAPTAEADPATLKAAEQMGSGWADFGAGFGMGGPFERGWAPKPPRPPRVPRPRRTMPPARSGCA